MTQKLNNLLATGRLRKKKNENFFEENFLELSISFFLVSKTNSIRKNQHEALSKGIQPIILPNFYPFQ